jgi:MFS superfamily sulfate permease-like transporter
MSLSGNGLPLRDALKHDLPASFVVFLVALPLCMGVAIASGAPVTAGLVTGIVGGLVTGALAGSPLQVSGPAAGLTVLVYQCIQQHGIETLGVAVLAAGAIQLAAGALRLGQWFRAVSPAVVRGMLAGIGVLIFLSQFQVMLDVSPKGSGLQNLLAMPGSALKALARHAEGPDASRPAEHAGLLKQAGSLHVRQRDLEENIERLLTGIAGKHAAPSSNSLAPSRSRPVSEILGGERLAALEATQREILERLDRLTELRDRDEWHTARQFVAVALADLKGTSAHAVEGSQANAERALRELRDSLKNHRAAALLGCLTIAVILVWQGPIARRLPFVPAPLAAVSAATVAAYALDLPVLYVEVPENLLGEINWPTLAELRTLLEPVVLFSAVEIAVIASAETLLCATAVDRIHQGSRTKYDQELTAQGVGNLVCGLAGALPMTGVIVRSTANIHAGARTRLSAILHGVWLLIFVVGFSGLLRMIPTASLAAILVYTGYKLIGIKEIKQLAAYGKSEVAIYATTLVAIVFTDLLKGVIVGVVLSLAKLMYTFTHLRIEATSDSNANRVNMKLNGSATFVRLPLLAEALERVPPQSELHVDLVNLDYIDHACLELLMNWERTHEATGGRLVVDWNSLHARFRSNGGGTNAGAQDGPPGQQHDPAA